MNKFLSCGFIISCFVLNACAAAGSGPQTWIDYPLNNTNLPLSPISITAHATHADGVARIEFLVNGERTHAVDVSGRRLEDATVEWTPQKAGKHTIEVQGLDGAGNSGMPAVVIINVGGALSPTTVTPTTTKTLTPRISITPKTITPTQTPTHTRTPTHTPKILTITPKTPQPPDQPTVTANQNANCRSGPTTEFDVEDYLMKGDSALVEGRLQDNSWFVITPPGESSPCWVAISVVDVSGDLADVKTVSPPPAPVVETEPPVVITEPPVDTTPPSITSHYASPSTIYQDYPCSGYSVSGVSTVQAYDDGGIANVTASWTIRNQVGAVVDNGNLTYSSSDGQTFQAGYGPSAFTGTITIEGLVRDNSGNSTTFIQNISIDYCP